MTRDDIIRMAREAGFTDSNPHSDIIVRHSSGAWVSVHDLLVRFHTLAVAAEREACVTLCDDLIGTRALARHCADAIRARSNT